MIYPSLIFSGEYTEKKICSDVMRDLKTDLLVPEDILEIFEMPCGREDIVMRQQTFKSLSVPSAERACRELYAHAALLCAKAECFYAARTDVERDASYLSLIYEVSDFSCKAAEGGLDAGFFRRFRDMFLAETEKTGTKELFAKTKELYSELCDTLRFKVRIGGGGGFSVSPKAEESCCDKLREAAKKLGLDSTGGFEFTEDAVTQEFTDAVAGYFSGLYSKLAEFRKEYSELFDEKILKYKKELGFYLSMHDLFKKIKDAGIPLSYPVISDERKIHIEDAYDITLLCKNCREIIPNDVDFSTGEPFFFLTGANGGGKTTYLRAVGTSALLFICGCPVPARKAEMSCLDRIFTHFPKDERFDTSGRFDEEKERAALISDEAGADSLVLLNETYSTTTEQTAVKLTLELAKELSERGTFGIYVTHQQGMEDIGVPYLNVAIDFENENRRTYKICKRTENKGSYAKDVLRRYGLTKEGLEERSGEKKR